MAYIACLDEDNKVVNIIIAESVGFAKEITGFNCIEYTEGTQMSVGYSWNGTDFVSPEPVIETPKE